MTFRIALAGNPNCGKTALFNALTGGRAKVGNYPGVTVEKKEGTLSVSSSASGFATLRVLDLPGTYSLDAKTPDEMITSHILLGQSVEEKTPDLIVAVADATHLERTLGLVLELKELKRPLVLALNMIDLAEKRGLKLNLSVLAQELGCPVVGTAAVYERGISELIHAIENLLTLAPVSSASLSAPARVEWKRPQAADVQKRFKRVDEILSAVTEQTLQPTRWTDSIDRFLLHPVWGSLFLLGVLACIFQCIFNFAQGPIEWIKWGIQEFSLLLNSLMADGPLKRLLIDGVIAGVGSVLVFLPQILLLFTFIQVLEDSGYMARAAFLMDRVMGKVGLHGRAFIPLLSSFACAVPGIMATRTIENKRDRLSTILVAPLITCSARLPVYSLLIGAFISNKPIWGVFHLQGLVMLGLYLAGIAVALLMALVFKSTLLKGKTPPLLMELPTYKRPSLKGILIGLAERAKAFVRRAGTVILTVSIILWYLSSYPAAPKNAQEPPISYSYAGKIGHALEPLVRPIGFNWQIAVALIPGFAAREVMIGSLATVYAVEKTGGSDAEEVSPLLGDTLKRHWSLATALSLLVWYVLACQCLSTLAVTRRETHSWAWPAFMLFYMTCLAYAGSFVTYQVARHLGF